MGAHRPNQICEAQSRFSLALSSPDRERCQMESDVAGKFCRARSLLRQPAPLYRQRAGSAPALDVPVGEPVELVRDGLRLIQHLVGADNRRAVADGLGDDRVRADERVVADRDRAEDG